MKDFFSKQYGYVTTAVVLFLIVFFSGFYFGERNIPEYEKITTLINKKDTNNPVDFAIFWQAWNIINEKYIPTASTSTERVSDQVRVYGAVKGMVDSLGDPYTTFFPPVESKAFNDEISGTIGGVGMEVGVSDGQVVVIAPLKDTPAYKAGIKAGDKILTINGTSTFGLKTEEAVSMIRGEKGTTVKLTLGRTGTKEPITVSIVRDIINIPTIDTETKGDVFIIHMYNFSAISANLFRNALREFILSGKTKLIVDLRGNPGGYLEAAVDMASWFLPVGKTVVKEDFRDDGKDEAFRSKGYNIFSDQLKLVVMIDEGSASASEILAGALHDHGIATLVGAKSFGKGSVQELVNLTPDTSLKVTIARWLTPNGNSISHQGIIPDVVVKLDQEKYVKGTDTQIEKALEILGK
jgi:carboxyl-terminal processing protease